jgi:hypothetical protein
MRRFALVSTLVAIAAVTIGSVAYATDIWRTVEFIDHDDRLFTDDGDWSWGDYKGECGNTNVVVGVSSTKAGSCNFSGCRPEATHRLLCSNDPKMYFAEFGYTVGGWGTRVPYGEEARADTSTGDWAPGMVKLECGYSDAVTGVAQTPWTSAAGGLSFDGSVLHGLRCGHVLNSKGPQFCTVMNFHDRDARESTIRGDWDRGYYKGECAPGRYVKGIAQWFETMESDAGSRARRILCCSPRF